VLLLALRYVLDSSHMSWIRLRRMVRETLFVRPVVVGWGWGETLVARHSPSLALYSVQGRHPLVIIPWSFGSRSIQCHSVSLLFSTDYN
jgi:hypothetical protein